MSEQEQKIEFYEQRDFSKKLTATIDFIRQNFLGMAKCIVFIAGPVSLFFGIAFSEFMGSYIKLLSNPTPPDESAFFADLGVSYFLLIIASSISSILTVVCVIGYMKIYYQKPAGEKIQVGEVFKLIGGYFFKILGTVVLVSLLTVFATFLLIIPGIYVFVACSLVFSIAIFEDTNLVSAIGRSFSLIKGKWWSTFGVIMVTYFISGAVGGLFAVPYYFFFIIKMFSLESLQEGFLAEPTLVEKISEVVISAVLGIGNYLAYSIPLIALSFQYFNLVERKESLGLITQIENLDSKN